MSSLKQIAANRRNALKSTGPTTDEGKARSRCNAVRHGLTAETVIAGLEDAEDYQAFEATVTADYEAETAVERELVSDWQASCGGCDEQPGLRARCLSKSSVHRTPQSPKNQLGFLLSSLPAQTGNN